MQEPLTREKQFHLAVSREDIGKYVILPGDPGRVPKIAALLDNARQVACNREYHTWTGTLDSVPVSVTSTGIGGPSAAIALEELVKCGAHTFIRVGTSGGIVKEVVGGDLVIATASVRGDGTTAEYLPEGYPAAADFQVVSALVQAAKALSTGREGNRFHTGVVQSKDSFYGELDPDSMPEADRLHQRWKAYERCGCLVSEMESAALFAVGAVRRVRVGAVFTALWNIEREKAGLSNPVCEDSSRAIRCGVEALRLLIRQDREGQ